MLPALFTARYGYFNCSLTLIYIRWIRLFELDWRLLRQNAFSITG